MVGRDDRRPGPAVPVVVGVYTVVGLVWIAVSTGAVDPLSELLDITPATVELVKGVGFVLVTAAALWVSLQRWQSAYLEATSLGRADLELRERRFRNLAEHTQGGVYRLAFTPTVHLEYISPQFEDLTGYSADEMKEDPGLLLRRVHPEDRDLLDVLPLEDPRAGRPSPGVTTFRFQKADGSWVWLEDHHTPEVGPDGHLTADQGITFDVTDRRRQEEATARALEHEREASELLRRTVNAHQTFLSSISHELRTPLTNVLGLAATVEAHWAAIAEDERTALLQRLTTNAQRLQRLLDDLLDLDRLQRGVLDLHPTPDVDLPDLVGRIVAELEAPDHTVRVAVPDATVSIDVPKVERILDNLLRNAVKHTPAGTSVSVTATVDDAEVQLVVEDDGPGLGPGADDLFQAFRQGDSAATDPNPGTGVGLSLVRDFATLHGGEAWCEDVEPHGARFCVRLPQGASAA